MNVLITDDIITIIHPASQTAAVADSAYEELLEKSVAKIINTAANTGETEIKWIGDMTVNLLNKLRINEYTIKNTSGNIWVIHG